MKMILSVVFYLKVKLNNSLRSVLDELDNTKGLDHIYCLGDMIDIGPISNEVLDMLFSRNDISIITGKQDYAILALAR